MGDGQGSQLGPVSAAGAAGVVSGRGNVPARNPDFAGREEQLADIRAGLLAGGPVVVHAVRGMGGAGKSQVAIEYAHRHAGDYALTWWLDCGNRVLLGQQYAELAIHLGHGTRDAPPQEMRRAAISALRQHPSWLLVFDSVANPPIFRQWLPDGPGHVLITSGSDKEYWNGLASLVPVGPLPRAESVHLLRRRVPGFTDTDADALADALGDLPLSLALASAWIAESGTPPAESVRLQTDYARRLSRSGRTWGPRACATAIITANVPPDPKAPAAWPTWARLYPHLPHLAFQPQDTGPTTGDTVLSAVWYLISSGNASEAETQAARLHQRRESPYSLGPDHEDTLRAAAALAAANRALGRYVSARIYGTKTLTRRRRLHGEDHPDTLTAASDLADILSDMGDHEAARELDADTLKRRRRVLGKHHPDTRRSAENLARDRRALRETGWRGWRAELRRRATAWWREWRVWRAR